MFKLIKLLLISGFITNQIDGADSSIIVRYKEPYEIICEFDDLKDPVKWIYNAATVFSCEAPYRAGECKIQDGNYRYNIEYESNRMTMKMGERDIIEWKNVGANWTCSHGNHQETYSFDQTESPMVCSTDIPDLEEPLDLQSTATITIGINSTKSYTVTWSSKRRGVIKTEEFMDTYKINDASIDIQTSCLDNVDTFTYLIDNAFSFPVGETFELKVKCETKVLEDEMNKTIEVELGQDAVFHVLYAGHMEPNNITWYRRMGTMTTDLDFLTDYRIQKTSQSHSMGIIIQSVQKQDVGTYTAELYSETKKTLLDFELVLKSREADPPFSWYIGIAIGAGGAILICVVIYIAVVMIKKITSKSNDDNYLTPKSVPQTPPPPVPHNTTTTATTGSSCSCNDSDFYELSENYENVTSAPYISDVDVE